MLTRDMDRIAGAGVNVAPANEPIDLGAPGRGRTAAQLLACLLVCAPLTIGAVLAFPIWDDAWLWLLLKEHGVDTIVSSMRDRPLYGGLWWCLARSETTLWIGAFVAQAVLWPTLGGVAALLWKGLFPELGRYRGVVACVTVAPFLSRVQMITANIALGALLSVVLAYAALLLVVRSTRGDTTNGRAGLIAGFIMLGAGIVIIEYAIAVAIVMLVFLWAAWRFGPDFELRRRAFWLAVATMIVSACAYATYAAIADASVRPAANVSPLYVVELGWRGLLSFPFRMLSAVWRTLVGGLASALTDVGWTSKASGAAIAYGCLVAGLLGYGSRSADPAGRQPDAAVLGPRALLLAVAFVAGLSPLVAMARMPWEAGDGMASRFEIPLLPIAAGLTVLGGIRAVRPRFWVIPVLLFGFAAGHAAFSQAWAAVREREAMAALGDALRAHVSLAGGHTVAVLPLRERALGPRRPYELTARLTNSWPAELRSRFWAYRSGGGPRLYGVEEAVNVFGPRGTCRRPAEVNTGVRLVTRKGPLDRLIWVAPHPDGSVSIEPYCIEDGGGRPSSVVRIVPREPLQEIAP